MFQSLAKLMKEERARRGKMTRGGKLNQDDFARQLGIKRSRLVEWEQATAEPRFTLTELVEFRRNNRELFERMLEEAAAELSEVSGSQEEVLVAHGVNSAVAGLTHHPGKDMVSGSSGRVAGSSEPRETKRQIKRKVSR